MIALDTNVLARLLLGDDEAQVARASACIERAVTRGERVYIPQVALCETVWVLRSAGKKSRPELAAIVEAIVATPEFLIEDREVAVRALRRFKAGGADYADYIISERSADAGCEAVATFDEKLLAEPGFLRP